MIHESDIKEAKTLDDVLDAEKEFKKACMSMGIDSQDIKRIIQLSETINNKQGYLEFSQKSLIPYYEEQRENFLSMGHEASNQAGTSRQTDAPPDGTEKRESHQTLCPEASKYPRQDSLKALRACLVTLGDESNNEQRVISRQADASSSSQSFPEIQQPFAAYHPAEAQHESTSQRIGVRRQDQTEQIRNPLVQQYEGHNQADPSRQADARPAHAEKRKD